jgi:rhodanese-related sulfurtransferase
MSSAAALLFSAFLVAFDEPDPSGGSYCGIYAVYGALNAIGIDVDFRSLLEVKYVGSEWGSSLAELRLAVEDSGGEATPLEALTAASIRFLDSPLILHVRPPGRETEYSHWILVLGVRDGKAVVVDAPEPPHEKDVAQLLAASDGIGLYVRRSMQSAWPMILASRLAMTPVIFACAAVLVVVGGVLRRRRSSSTAKASAIVLVAAAAASINYFSAFGFYHNQAGIAYVRGRHSAPSVPTIQLDDARSLADDSGVKLIDARLPSSFKLGHPPGAINLPIFSGMVGRDRAAQDLKSAKTVVVYCQGPSCSWAEALAEDLALRGVPDVRLMKEGWEGWKATEAGLGKKSDESDK